MIEHLEDWERTHYSKEITPESDGKSVVIMGWIRELRDMGKIKFLKLADKEDFVQIKIKEGEVNPNLIKKVEGLRREYVVAIKGIVSANKEAPGGREIVPLEIKVLNTSEGPLPLEVETKKTPAELTTRLDSRFIDLRKAEIVAIFKITGTLKLSFLEYFKKQGFVNVNTPVIVSAAAEGGAELFPVKYFDKEVFLNQSPQLYKQILMASGLDKVSIVTPVFRAEPHDTPRHLNEAVQMDIEVAFVRNEEDALKYYDNFLKYAIERVKEDNLKELEALKINLETLGKIKRITYDEALETLKKGKMKINWGEDIPPEGEKVICKDYNPVIITKWPTKIRAFYSMPEPSNPKVCRAYDLLYNGIEISSGAQRVHVYEDLLKVMKSRGINPKNFEFYLNAFRYGMPPHAGWSIGLERFTMALLNLPNIKEATLFPRTKERVTP